MRLGTGVHDRNQLGLGVLMDDITDRLEKIKSDALSQSAARKMAREAQAAENRRKFPTAARLMDLFKDFQPRILYAKENGHEIGKRLRLDSEKSTGGKSDD